MMSLRFVVAAALLMQAAWSANLRGEGFWEQNDVAASGEEDNVIGAMEAELKEDEGVLIAGGMEAELGGEEEEEDEEGMIGGMEAELNGAEEDEEGMIGGMEAELEDKEEDEEGMVGGLEAELEHKEKEEQGMIGGMEAELEQEEEGMIGAVESLLQGGETKQRQLFGAPAPPEDIMDPNNTGFDPSSINVPGQGDAAATPEDIMDPNNTGFDPNDITVPGGGMMGAGGVGGPAEESSPSTEVATEAAASPSDEEAAASEEEEASSSSKDAEYEGCYCACNLWWTNDGEDEEAEGVIMYAISEELKHENGGKAYMCVTDAESEIYNKKKVALCDDECFFEEGSSDEDEEGSTR